MFQLNCRSCGAVHTVDEKLIGRTGKCKHCGERIKIAPPIPDFKTVTSEPPEAGEMPPGEHQVPQPAVKGEATNRHDVFPTWLKSPIALGIVVPVVALCVVVIVLYRNRDRNEVTSDPSAPRPSIITATVATHQPRPPVQPESDRTPQPTLSGEVQQEIDAAIKRLAELSPNDRTAVADCLRSIERFRAKLEVGTTLGDYRRELGALWGEIKVFADRNDHVAVLPGILLSIGEVYREAAEAWEVESERSIREGATSSNLTESKVQHCWSLAERKRAVASRLLDKDADKRKALLILACEGNLGTLGCDFTVFKIECLAASLKALEKSGRVKDREEDLLRLLARAQRLMQEDPNSPEATKLLPELDKLSSALEVFASKPKPTSIKFREMSDYLTRKYLCDNDEELRLVEKKNMILRKFQASYGFTDEQVETAIREWVMNSRRWNWELPAIRVALTNTIQL